MTAEHSGQLYPRSHETSVFDEVANAIAAAEDVEDEVLTEQPRLQDLLATFQRWAEVIVASGLSLRPTEALTYPGVEGRKLDLPPETWTILADVAMIRPRIEIAMAKAGLSRSEQATRRLIKILPMLVSAGLSLRAFQYLERVASLYVWGFDMETIALCRATLEAALEDSIVEAEARRVLKKKRGYITLKDRISAAAVLSRLDVAAVAGADAIRDSGNDFLHPARPSKNLLEPLDAIAALGRVLAQLFP